MKATFFLLAALCSLHVCLAQKEQQNDNAYAAKNYLENGMAFAKTNQSLSQVPIASQQRSLTTVSSLPASNAMDNYMEEVTAKADEPTSLLPEVYNTYLVDPNSEFSGFGPAYYRDELVFASDRNTERPIYTETQRPFLDLYEAEIIDGHMRGEKLFAEGINTDIHESNAAFTRDGKVLYFTRNSNTYRKINGRQTAVLQIFRAERIDGKWQDIKPLSISSNRYSVAHPSISADGKTLYFSSDMPGGLGGSDIYMAPVLKDEKLGTPVNLGPAINSKSQEQFPFISENGNLYFASDRESGYGGLDLYKSNGVQGTFSPSLNLGASINGATDDFSLITKENQGTGYFSSNRTGKDKIYRFELEDATSPAPAMLTLNGQSIQGKVTDVLTDKPIVGVKVSLKKPDGSVLRQTIVEPDGSFEIFYGEDGEYVLEYSEWQYKKSSILINWTSTNVDAPKLQLKLEPKHIMASSTPKTSINAPKNGNSVIENEAKIDLEALKINTIYFGFDQSGIAHNAAEKLDQLVKVLMKNAEIKLNISAYADKSGSEQYNNGLSQRRAQAAVKYLVQKGIARDRIASRAYGESKAVAGDPAKNRKCEFQILDSNK